MMDAVDYVVEQQIPIPSVLLEDCRISLQFRKKYSKKLDGGGDEGHEFLILILNYCFQSLKPLVPQVTRKADKIKATQFHFTDLELSDSEEEEAKEEEDIISAKVRKPERPKEPTHDFTFDDLIKGTEYLQACAFLDSVNRAMEAISHAYQTLKLKMRALNVRHPGEALHLAEDVMEAAVTTNFCIRQVQSMEKELELDHPHLSSFYRVLGCVFLAQHIDDLNTRVQEWGRNVPKTDMTAFIGDLVECGFRNPSDPQNCVCKLVRNFCRKWSLPQGDVSKIAEASVFVVHIEIQTDAEVQPPHVVAEIEELGLNVHSWMQHETFIGGDRNILNSQRLLQGLSNVLMTSPQTKFAPKPGSFGIPWDEGRYLAKKIQGDMDQLLMADILPELLASCQHGLLSTEILGKDELLPFFKLLCLYIANPAKPVSLALTFGVHAILTSIFELQGHNDIFFITLATKVWTTSLLI
jgi:hypothetical protein